LGLGSVAGGLALVIAIRIQKRFYSHHTSIHNALEA